jgi:hypothetical protein
MRRTRERWWTPVPAGVRGTDGAAGGAGGALSLADERRPDAVRLQKAIDGCAPGKAVELRPEGERQFLSAGRCC